MISNKIQTLESIPQQLAKPSIQPSPLHLDLLPRPPFGSLRSLPLLLRVLIPKTRPVGHDRRLESQWARQQIAIPAETPLRRIEAGRRRQQSIRDKATRERRNRRVHAAAIGATIYRRRRPCERIRRPLRTGAEQRARARRRRRQDDGRRVGALGASFRRGRRRGGGCGAGGGGAVFGGRVGRGAAAVGLLAGDLDFEPRTLGSVGLDAAGAGRGRDGGDGRGGAGSGWVGLVGGVRWGRGGAVAALVAGQQGGVGRAGTGGFFWALEGVGP